jgi:hypothetical protein
MPVTPDQLFTPINIVSVGVATLAVNVFANTFYKLLKWPQTWTAFVAALVIAYLVVAMQSEVHWYDWVLAFFNACLLYCSALGINEVGAVATQKPGQGAATAQPFFTSWLRR